MDQSTKGSSDNLGFTTPQPQQRTAGGLARAAAFAALWAGHRKMLLVFAALIAATALLPQKVNPFHHLAVGLGTMDADEVRASAAAKADAARQLAAAQAEELSLVATIKETMAGEIIIGQLGDYACFASRFFGQGRNSDYADFRDMLRQGCGLSDAVRENAVRNLVFRLREVRARIIQLEAAGR